MMSTRSIFNAEKDDQVEAEKLANIMKEKQQLKEKITFVKLVSRTRRFFRVLRREAKQKLETSTFGLVMDIFNVALRYMVGAKTTGLS